MNRTIILFIAAIALLSLPVSATVINIPDDYGTIQEGIDIAESGDTVLVDNGTYEGNGNRDIDFGGKEVLLRSVNGPESTIIDCGGTRGFYFHSAEDSLTIVNGFTITNGHADPWGGGIFCANSAPLILNCIIYNNSSGIPDYDAGYGGGIFVSASSGLILDGCEISNNQAYDGEWQGWEVYGCGGGIYSEGSNITIKNCLIRSNSSSNGSGIFAQDSDLTIKNCTFALNIQTTIQTTSTNVSALNSIIWQNSGNNVSFENESIIDISYCDIQDTLWQGDGNISCDPLFCNPGGGDFQLAENSCCAGTGHNGEDIGAFGVGCEYTVVSQEQDIQPIGFSLSQNYPNPFNASTSISLALPEAGDVRLVVYDLLGRQVETLFDAYRPAGTHQVTFDASALSSGIYFYRVQAGDMIETKRMLLLK